MIRLALGVNDNDISGLTLILIIKYEIRVIMSTNDGFLWINIGMWLMFFCFRFKEVSFFVTK